MLESFSLIFPFLLSCFLFRATIYMLSFSLVHFIPFYSLQHRLLVALKSGVSWEYKGAIVIKGHGLILKCDCGSWIASLKCLKFSDARTRGGEGGDEVWRGGGTHLRFVYILTAPQTNAWLSFSNSWAVVDKFLSFWSSDSLLAKKALARPRQPLW